MDHNDTLVDSWTDEFRSAYDADDRNARRQSFEEYWGWVRAFLITGGAGQRGWLEHSEEVLRRVHGAAPSEGLRTRLLSVGRTIAAEWAKDSRYRRIHSNPLQGSPNLLEWSGQLQRAAGRDVGDGTAIGQALDAIERAVRATLGR